MVEKPIWIGKESLFRLRKDLCLPKLTIRVHFSDYSFHGAKVTAYRAEMTHDDTLSTVRTYLRLLTPLEIYRTDLKKLFLHLAHPLNWTRDYRQLEFKRPGNLERGNKSLTDLVGRTIMGQEFERLSQGKEEKLQSQWLRREEYDAQEAGPTNPLLYYG